MAKYETSLLGRYAKGHDNDGDTYGEIVFVYMSGGQIVVGINSFDDGVIDEYYTNEIQVYADRILARDAWIHREAVS